MRIQLAQNRSTTHGWFRWGLTVALGVVGICVAVWLGEDLKSNVPSATIFLALVSGLFVYWVSPYSSLASKHGIASVVMLCVAGGWYMGRTIAISAFNDCVERGEIVRVALQQYQAQYDEFPENLRDLRLHDLPGRRWLRGTLLSYQRTLEGYELSFSDWLVTQRATETTRFVAEK